MYSHGTSFNSLGLDDYAGQLIFSDIVGDFEIKSIAMLVLTENGIFTDSVNQNFIITSAVPVPAAVWLFGSGLIGLIGIARRTKA